MAKKSDIRQTPSVDDLVKELKEHGGKVIPWHDIKAAHYGSTLMKALRAGVIDLTKDGGLVLIEPEEIEEDND